MSSEPAFSGTQQTFEEWKTNPFVQPLSSSETLGWKAIHLNIVWLQPTEKEETGPINENHLLLLQLEGETRIQSSMLIEGKLYETYQWVGSFHLIPGWHRAGGRWYQPVKVAFLQFPPSLAIPFEGSAFHRDPAHIEILPELNFQDALLLNLMTALCQELQNPGPFSALFAESAAQMIMLQMLRKHSNLAINLPPIRARLTERQLRIIDDYIDSNLSEKISLTELASLLFMSQSHFERLFRASLGFSPYHYVLYRKIERAKLLLQYSSLPLQQVAEQCGFANQSHFTRHFTRQVGISPARFRNRL